MKMDVKHLKEENKFFVVLEGFEASLNYKLVNEKSLEIVNTMVPNRLRGKGIGKELILSVFNYAKTNNLSIIPSCPFAVKFIEMNRQFSIFCQQA
ncbi:MAG TPA: GNAT family N-acetyltransferase [Cytophagaceae bacterium]